MITPTTLETSVKLKTRTESPEEAQNTDSLPQMQRREAPPAIEEAPLQDGPDPPVAGRAMTGRRLSQMQRRMTMQSTQGKQIAPDAATCGATATVPRRLRPIFYSEYMSRQQVQRTAFHILAFFIVV
jgi:hypothetical protein